MTVGRLLAQDGGAYLRTDLAHDLGERHDRRSSKLPWHVAGARNDAYEVSPGLAALRKHLD